MFNINALFFLPMQYSFIIKSAALHTFISTILPGMILNHYQPTNNQTKLEEKLCQNCQAPGPVQCPGQGPVSSPWSRSRSELLNSKFSVKFSKERTWRDTIIKQATTISPAVPLHISGCATHHQTFFNSHLW